MGRQQTLGKFFEVPDSMGAPPKTQGRLDEMWKKPKKDRADEGEQENDKASDSVEKVEKVEKVKKESKVEGEQNGSQKRRQGGESYEMEENNKADNHEEISNTPSTITTSSRDGNREISILPPRKKIKLSTATSSGSEEAGGGGDQVQKEKKNGEVEDVLVDAGVDLAGSKVLVVQDRKTATDKESKAKTDATAKAKAQGTEIQDDSLTGEEEEVKVEADVDVSNKHNAGRQEKTTKKRPRIVDSEDEEGDAPAPSVRKTETTTDTKSSKDETAKQPSNPFSLSKSSKSTDTGKTGASLPSSSSVVKKANDEDGYEDDVKAKMEVEEAEIDSEAEEREEAEEVAATFSSLIGSSADDKQGKSTWKVGEPVPYSAITDCFEQIDGTTKRLAISSYLSQLLLKVARSPGKDGGDLLRVVYLCINRLGPDYEGVELGIGESLIVKAIAQSTGRSPQAIKTDLRKVGDLGLVAQQSRGKQKTLFAASKLTVPFVFKCLEDIAKSSGNASQAKKVGIINKVLTACNGTETKFIIRSLEGKLRIGLAEKTLVTALAHAIVLKDVGSKKLAPEELTRRLEKGAEVVKQVYSELPNYDLIVPALLEGGIEGLKERCKMCPGVPLKPMLAKPTKAIGEVLDRFEGKEFTCEYKYDGERAQIHMIEGGKIVVFSRNSENMSAKYPDLIESIPKCVKEGVTSFVLDCEAVAYDLEAKKLLPFQDLARRKRKDVRTEDITVRAHVFAFDLLYLNGESLLTKELKERRELLHANFRPVEGEFGYAKSSDGTTSDEIAEFLDESIKDGCEGLMVKRLTTEDSTYEPSRRSINWLKLKKDYLAGVGDSCDLVVVGAYYGKGKRTNVYGAFLLACYDPDSENFQTTCKIGTGFSEQTLLDLYALLKPLELEGGKRSDIQADPSKPPNVWFEPKVVFEVLTADLTLSPTYMAGQGLVDERGISLRFPRFIRLRDDKGPEDATTGEQLAEFYERQATAHGGNGGDGFGDEY